MTTMTLPLSAAMTVESANGRTQPVSFFHQQGPVPAAASDPFAELFADLDDENPEPEVPPLTRGWKFAVVMIGILAAVLAVGGMTFAFHSVSSEMSQVPSIGPRWAWMVPLIADVGIFVFSGVDIVLQRAAMPHPLSRWMVYALTVATITMNLAADGADLHLTWLLRAGAIVAHVTGPLAWVVFIETVRHAVRTAALKTSRTLREPIPFARWASAPWPTLKLWRRMVMWGEVNYRKALRRDLYRLEAVGVARRDLGWNWRRRISPDIRLRMNLGLIDAAGVREAIRSETDPTRPTESIPATPDPTRRPADPTGPKQADPPDPTRPDPVDSTDSPDPTDRPDSTDSAATRPDPTDRISRVERIRPSRVGTGPTATSNGRSLTRAESDALGRLAEARAALAGERPTEDRIRGVLGVGAKSARAVRDALVAEQRAAATRPDPTSSLDPTRPVD